MRTTIEIPDVLFRRTKALAAARGFTLKQLIVHAIEREVIPAKAAQGGRRPKLPVVHLEPGCILDLSSFDFDDFLA